MIRQAELYEKQPGGQYLQAVISRVMTLLQVRHPFIGYRIDSNGRWWLETFGPGLGNIFVLFNATTADTNTTHQLSVHIERRPKTGACITGFGLFGTGSRSRRLRGLEIKAWKPYKRMASDQPSAFSLEKTLELGNGDHVCP